MTKILPNKPTIDNQEVKAVKRVLDRGWLIPGEEVRKLENNIKKLVSAKYAVATNSGSAALHLSLIALGVTENDEVIIPTYTCAALLNAVYYLQATPAVVDVGENSFTIDPEKVKKAITNNTKVIIVPHTFGFPARIDEIKKFGIPVIEDCAHAPGSYYLHKPLGSWGDISIFSFYATKVIATGHGGMITTNDKKYFNIVKDLIHYDKRKDYKVRYNYQLTDILASIGNVQFQKLQSFIERRRYIASRYIEILQKTDKVQYWPKKEDSNLNHYRFIIKFDNKKTRNNFKAQLSSKGVLSVVPIDEYQLLHRYLKLDEKQFINSEILTQATLALPVYPSLTEKEVNKIVNILDLLCKKL